MTSQFVLMARSFSQLRGNLILALPLLFYYAASVPLSFLTVLVFLLPMGVFLVSHSMVVSVVVGAVLFSLVVFLFFVVYAFFQASLYGMICDVILKGGTSFDRIMLHGRRFFMPLLKTFFAYFVILLSSALVAAVLPALGFVVFGLSGAVALGVVAFMLWIVAMLVLSVLTFFSLPIVLLDNVSGFRSVKLALKYGIGNFSHSVSAAGVLSLVVFGFLVVYVIVSLPASLASVASEFGGVGYLGVALFFGVLSYGVSILASLVLSVVVPAFLFNSYIDRNPVKKWK